MPANINIQSIPVFQPYTFDLYIAPLTKYKEEYDRVEKEYNTLAEAASVLEKLKADAPNSLAYRQYQNYINDLQAEADYLAYNGLTAGHRMNLNKIRQRYGSELIPIMTAVQKREQDIERMRNLNPSEITNYDANNKSVDDYLFGNPSMRVVNLEEIRKNAELTGTAWSERVFGDLSPHVLEGVLDGGYTLLGLLQGFVSGGPNGQNSLIELLNAEQQLQDLAPAYSEGIRLLRTQLESLGFDSFDANGLKLILNTLLSGYGQGLKGKYDYRNTSSSTTPGGRINPIVTNRPSVHSRTMPLLDATVDARDNLERLGATYNNADLTYSFVPNSVDYIANLKFHFGSINTGLGRITPIYMDIPEAVANYRDIMNGTYVYEYNGHSYNINLSHKDQLEEIVNTIGIYNPLVAEQIKNGTFTGNIRNVISNIITDVTTNTRDYGVRLFDVTYADDKDTRIITDAVKRFIQSNDNEYQSMEISADGKTFKETGTTSLNDDGYASLKVSGISFLPTDSEHLIVNATINNQLQTIKIPVNAINDQAAAALMEVNQHATAFTTFENEHGKFQAPEATNPTPTDMENIFVAIDRLNQSYENPASVNDVLHTRDIMLTLTLLARDNNKDQKYYVDLYTKYLALEYATSMMYPQFIQNFGYAIGLVNNQDYEQNTYQQVATGVR